MFPATHHALKAYASVGVETGVAAANPHKLILMLYEGAMLALASAKRHMQAGETAAKCAAVGKALMIIDGGLKPSLDLSSGGELAHNLLALYDYMSRRLVHANLKNDAAMLAEVAQLLSELSGAWESIGNTPAAPATAAGAEAPVRRTA